MFYSTKEELIKEITDSGTLRSKHITDAFRAIDRADFMAPEHRKEAYENYPAPIGYGQTISQPETVAFMLELLQPTAGNRILDVGSGSGWQSALLAHIVGESGKVYAMEIIPELATLGAKNIEKYGFISGGRVEVIAESAEGGLVRGAPFDRIIAAASASHVPDAWKSQLAVGGRIVLPIKDTIYLIIKESETEFTEIPHPGFIFVPFIEKRD